MATYILDQYNHKVDDISQSNNYMTLITQGTSVRLEGTSDTTGLRKDPFLETCVKFSGSGVIESGKNYYCHCKIRRRDDRDTSKDANDQKITIKLANSDETSIDKELEQYIKEYTVVQGISDEKWADIEFIFTPLANFDTIVFELNRSLEDYSLETQRYPIIAFEELSQIQNIKSNISMIKCGIQSRPGLLMCINGEEIRVGRTGIYEIKNGIMTVNFFSVCAGVQENSTAMQDWMNTVDAQLVDINAREAAGEISVNQAAAERAEITCQCFFSTPKKDREISSFTLDYMYRDKTTSNNG